MTKIKICGIKSEEHALAVVEAGADFLGMVFAHSPRQVTPAQAKKIVKALKEQSTEVKTVGVFVNAPYQTVNKIAASVGFDYVQVNGDEPWEYCRQIEAPIIKVIRVSRNYRPADIIKNLEYGTKVLGDHEHIFLLDANVREKYGGTGQKFDWKLARPIAERFPVIVAGGLKPANVAEAVETIRPWGVDVSSGVETKGAKDMEKIRIFIETVRTTDAKSS